MHELDLQPGKHPSDLHLHNNDLDVVKALSVSDVQDWCTERMGIYQSNIAAFRAVRRSETPLAELSGQHDLLDVNAETISALQHEDVDSWCKLRIDEYKSRIRALRSVYNSAALINRLPPELLMEVFKNIPHTSKRTRHGALAALHACRAWYSLICQTPHFWRNFLSVPRDLSNPSPRTLALFYFALAHSKSLDLELELFGFPPLSDVFILTQSRISSLTVTLRSTKEAVALGILLYGEPTQGLQELKITLWDESIEHPKLPPPSLLPNLMTLRIASPLFLPDYVSPSLRHLDLYYADSNREDGAILRSLLRALQQCPLLESLRIGWSAIPIRDDEDGIPQGEHGWVPVGLHALRSLSIMDRPDIVAAFLRYLRFSDTAQVRLVFSGTDNFLPSQFAALPQLSVADEVRLCMSCTRPQLEAYRAGALTVQMKTVDLYPIDGAELLIETYVEEVALLFQALGNRSITTLKIDMSASVLADPPHRSLNTWRDILRAFPDLERLEAPADCLGIIAFVLMRKENGAAASAVLEATDDVAPPFVRIQKGVTEDGERVFVTFVRCTTPDAVEATEQPLP